MSIRNVSGNDLDSVPVSGHSEQCPWERTPRCRVDLVRHGSHIREAGQERRSGGEIQDGKRRRWTSLQTSKTSFLFMQAKEIWEMNGVNWKDGIQHLVSPEILETEEKGT